MNVVPPVGPSGKVSIVLVEDNRLLREGLAALVNRERDLEVVGAFGSLDPFLDRLPEIAPQIVLVDAVLAGRSSLTVVSAIRRRYAAAKLIVMDLFPAQVDLLALISAGASGFLLEDATYEELLDTVREVAAGHSVLPQTLMASLFS